MYSSNTNNNNASKNSKETMKFDFSEKGFLTEKGIIREELITTEAKEIAKEFVKKGLSVTQLRAFFNEVKIIKNRLKSDGTNYDKEFPLILLVKSKAEYKSKAKRAKIPEVFKNFLIASVDRIWKDKKEGKGKEIFDAYILFFEAIVGYFYGAGGEK